MGLNRLDRRLRKLILLALMLSGTAATGAVVAAVDPRNRGLDELDEDPAGLSWVQEAD